MGEKIRAVYDGNVFCPEEHVDFKINGHYVLRYRVSKEGEGFHLRRRI